MAAALKEKVESAARLPDIQNTVAVRASLAQEFVRAAAEQLRVCETLIHDQHLQHQVRVSYRIQTDKSGHQRPIVKLS